MANDEIEMRFTLTEAQILFKTIQSAVNHEMKRGSRSRYNSPLTLRNAERLKSVQLKIVGALNAKGLQAAPQKGKG